MEPPLLCGEFDHALDPKGRVTLPVRYRDYFSDGAVLVRFPDGPPCLSVFHPDAWREFDRKHFESLNVYENEADSWRIRNLYRNQDEVEPDKQGRVLIPAQRIRDLGLSGKVKILGSRTHLEIWNPETLATLDDEMRGGNA